MVRRKLSKLMKYNVTQKILQELADSESRAILFSIVRKPKPVDDIAYSCGIPLTTVYKKIKTLQDLTLVYVKRTEFTDSGKRIKLYKSRISKAEVTIQKLEPRLILVPN